MLTNLARQAPAALLVLTGMALLGCGDPPPERVAPPTRPIPASRPAPVPGGAAEYARLLAEVVTEEGLVRYDRLAEPGPAAALAAAIEWFATAPMPADETERLARWCNAYNAHVLAFVQATRRRGPLASVMDVPGFFDQRPCTVAGERLTLNQIENERVRPSGDARFHAALVCGAMSCPPLRREPYAADRLDTQLDDQCRRWVNEGGRFRVADGTLGLSEIIKWYAADFQRPPHGDPAGFVRAYAYPRGPIGRTLASDPSPPTTWLPYDWKLNHAQEPEPDG